MLPRSTPSSSSSSPSTDLETNSTLETNAYDHVYFVRELSRSITELKKVESEVFDGRRLLVKGMEEKRYQEITGLQNLIEDATEMSPQLLIHFLEKTAKQLLKYDIDRVAEIIGLFVKQNYFQRYPEQIQTIHRLLISLVASFNLLTEETREKRRMLFAALRPSIELTATNATPHPAAEEKEGEPGFEPLSTATPEGEISTLDESKDDLHGASPEGSSAFNLDAKVRVHLIDHFINELKRKKAEVIRSAKDAEIALKKEISTRTSSKSGKSVTLGLSAEQTREMLATLNDTIQNSNRTADWIACLNDFVTLYQISAFEMRQVFLRLSDDDIEVKVELGAQRIETVSPTDYFLQLLPRFIYDAKEASDLIDSYIYANKNTFNSIPRITALFGQLYGWQQQTPHFTEDQLFTIVSDLLARIQKEAPAITAEVALMPLIGIWKDYADKPLRNPAIPLRQFAQRWLLRNDVDCFKVVAGNSFFNNIVLHWKNELEKNQKKIPAGYALRFNANDEAVYPLATPASLTDTKYRHVYQLMLSQLTPVVTNKNEFISRCRTLFGQATLTNTDFEELHAQFVSKGKLPPQDTALLLPYKTALQHLVRKQDLELDAIDLPTLITRLLPDQTVILCHQSQESDKRLESKYEAIEGSVVAATLLENRDAAVDGDRFQVVMPVQTLQPDFSLQLQKMLGKLLQWLVNKSQYEKLESIPYFDSLVAILDNLQRTPQAQVELLDILLDEGDAEALNVGKGNALCRAIALHDTRLFSGLASVLSRYENLPYYQLARLNISPQFYESFNEKDHPFARQYILEFGDNTQFKLLYSLKKNYTNDKHLLQLLGVPNTRKNVIDIDVLTHLNQLYRMRHPSSREEKELYNLLSNLLLEFDHKNANQANLITILSQISNIIGRLNMHEATLKLAHIEQIKTLIAAGKPETIIAGLQSMIDGMKKPYPIIEDTSEYLSKDVPTVMAFLTTLQQRGRLHDFAFNRNQQDLDLLLDYIGNQPAAEQKQLLQQLNNGLAHHNLTLTKLKNEQGQSCLERASTKKIGLSHELILLGADECEPFGSDKNTCFVDQFLLFISKNHRLVRKTEWLALLIHLFTKPSIQTRQKLIHWFDKQTAASSELEYKTGDEARSTAIITDSPFLKSFFEAIDVARMPDVALALIDADRFEFLKALNDIHLVKTGRAVWSDPTSRSIINVFDAAFRKTTKSNTYTSYMQFAGFFTSHHHLIADAIKAGGLYFNFMQLALTAKITEQYTPIMGSQYIAAVGTIKAKKTLWETADNTKGLYDQLMQAIESNKNELRLTDITRLFNVVASLYFPKFYPIKTALAEIFKTPCDTWHSKIIKLIDTEFNFFKISQMDPELVKKQFEACTPSFNTILNKPDAIAYAFRIFANVTRNLTKYPDLEKWKTLSEHDKAARMAEALQLFNDNMPGDWNEANDIAFFTGLCLLTTYTLNKTPYHAQFAITLLTMYAAPEKVTRLLEDVATNQGKTFTIAMCIATQVKTWKKHHSADKPTLIPVVTLMDYLARENALENKPFYDVLGITSSDDINANTLVRYTTSEKLLFWKVANDLAPATQDEVNLDKSNWLLFIDETDVSLSDYRRKYVSASGFVANDMNPLLKLIWKAVLAGESDATIKSQLLAAKEYSKLPPFLQQHLRDELKHFIQKARAIKADASIAESKADTEAPRTGAIITVEKETGIVAANSIGRSGEPQFRQMKMYGADAPILPYEMAHDAVYYHDVFKEFPMVIGFSGTLGSPEERAEYKKDGYMTVNTARFSEQKLTRLTDILAPTDEEWNKTVANFIQGRVDNGQPVLVFFASIEEVKAFYKRFYADKPHGKINLFLGTESTTRIKKIVEDATEAGTITLATIIGGRGIDFQLIDMVIDQKGGMVVANAAVIDSFNVYAQLLARTARRNNKGMAINIISFEKLKQALDNNNILSNDLSATNFMQRIDLLRKLVLKDKFRSLEQEQERNYPWKLATDFTRNVLPKGPTRVFRNDQYHRYLLCYSLAEKGRTSEAVSRYNEEFKREIIAPKTLINVVLVLDVSSSMSTQLEAAKAKLAELPKAIAESNPAAKLQVAVIGYSDYKDAPAIYEAHKHDSNYWLSNNTTASKVLDFTGVEPALDFLKSLAILNGHDAAEAMELALYKAGKLNWPKPENGDRVMRQVFIVSDAPPHGVLSGSDDDFPGLKNPARLDWSSEAASLKGRGVEIHMIACSSSYNSTYETIAGITGSVTALGNASTLIDKIVQKVQQSDAIDEKLSGLNSLCVSAQMSREAMLEQAAEVIRSTMGVSSAAEARVIAEAKLHGMSNRNRF
jgi:hypothetical protein